MIWVIFMQVVPDVFIFKLKKLFPASEVHAIFTRSNVQDFKDLKKKRRFEQGSSSLEHPHQSL